MNFNRGKEERQGKKGPRGGKCKHFHIKWEGSEVKFVHYLGTTEEVKIQGNKEKAMGRIKWKSDVSLALILSEGHKYFFPSSEECP